ncbi:DNA repair protein RAD51 like 4 [Pseudolycoriella hygida]|uniref:DNA repair protein RAD51 like 4 n=1 Tax=Pseudolycoriella hygida TaxID=35572 RepID=A0A9Q0N2I4_9DIPT|nr:DNA repair protein RAD51 like 4 [Pseudolycoriella hygida]
MELCKNVHELFTDYMVNLLNKQHIFTVVDFIKEDTYKLTQITNLDLQVTNELKNELLELLTPFEGFGFKAQKFKTGITSFDEILGGGLKSGHLYDICGLSASGKTQICNTIAVNLAIDYKYETLYIDTKKDFSGQRIYSMLNARNCTDIECGVIMNCIRCESVYDVHEFLTVLRELPSYLQNNKKIKCLIVDSLPTLWFPLLDGKSNGVSLLCEATNLMQKIAFIFDVIILLVNIVTRRTEIDSGNVDVPYLSNPDPTRQCKVWTLPSKSSNRENIGIQCHGKDFFCREPTLLIHNLMVKEQLRSHSVKERVELAL